MSDKGEDMAGAEFLSGGGELGALIRARDWSDTPLGPISGWPQSLRTTVGMLLRAPVPIVLLWGVDGIMLYNDAYSVFAGGRHPALLGAKVREGWPEVADFNDNVMKVGLAGGTLSYQDQELVLHRHGRPQTAWMNLDYSPVPDESGRPAGVIAFVAETTERVLGERRARESEARLGLVVDAATDYAIFTTDPQRRITSWSAGAARVFGYSAGEAIGMCSDVLWTPEDRAAAEPEQEVGTAQSEGCANDERWHQRADGGRVFLNGSMHPLPPGDDGRERGFIKIARDETERRAADLALHESEARYRALFEAIEAGFCIVEMKFDAAGEAVDYRMIEVNPAFERQTGLVDAAGRWVSGIAPGLERHWFETYGRVAQTGEAVRFENGADVLGDRWFDVYAFPAGPLGSNRVAVLFTDISDRRRAEMALRESEARFRHLADNAPMMVWVTDADAQCVFLSRSWYEFTGQTEEQALGLGWLDAVHPDDRGWSGELFLEANSRGEPFRLEYRVRRADGQYRWAIDAAEPRFDDKGGFLGYVGSVIDIDDRREIEEARRASEDRLRLATEAGQVGIWDFDPRSGELRWDDRCRALFGLSPDAAVDYQLFLDGLHPEDRAATQQAVEAAIQPGGSAAYDVEYRTIGIEDGIERWIAASGRAVFAEAGEAATRFVGTVIDISDERYAAHALAVSEAALREERGRLETLNRTGAAIAAELDLDRVVQMVTDAGVELTGAQFGAFFYNTTDDLGQKMMLFALTGAERSQFDFGMPRATAIFSPTFAGEGVVRSDDILADPRYGKSAPHHGMPEGHLPVRSYLAVSVTSRSGEVIGGLFFGHPEPGRFTAAHEGLMIGIAAQAAIAIDNARLFDKAQRDLAERMRAEEQLKRLNETLESRVEEEVAQRAEAEERLRQAQKMETVGQLTGGVAHDFNNLLQVVTGNLEILLRNLPEDSARLRRSADNAMKGAQRAATLTQRLLAFSRRQPLEPKPAELNKLVAGMSELLHRTLGETVEVETVLAPRLWRVEIDTNQLENAILNLAVNARDAMGSGGKLTIETSNTHLDQRYTADNSEVAPGQYVVICVSDTGIGMDAETVARAFEPFFTTKDVGRGTGLGLSMVYGFVKQSGGHLKIYSELGEGTTVKIYLPRYYGSVDEAEAAAEQPAPEGTRGETVLVCEDDADVRGYSVEVLRELGYRVLEAEDGPAALRIVERPDERIDLLFTDVVLPGGMTGAVLAEAARRARPDLKVLFTTGYARNAIVHHGRLDAGVELITKPFSYADLAARVRDLLDAPVV